jgi:hypothetical protein
MQRSTKELLEQDPFQKYPVCMFVFLQKKKTKKTYLPAKYEHLKERRQVTAR